MDKRSFDKDPNAQWHQATMKTADDLRTMAKTAVDRELTQMTLPQVDQLVNSVSRSVPAGNIPALILNGLMRLGRNQDTQAKTNVNTLFKGVNQLFDRAMYGAVFAGPAAVIWGYQNLLRIAGRDPDDSFPEGTWQFYVDYALREDTARHANETHGFDSIVKGRKKIGTTDRITAWIMAAAQVLHTYDQLLANEWRERVYTFTLSQLLSDPKAPMKHSKIYRKWQGQIPYTALDDAKKGETYPAYRRRKFDAFFSKVLKQADADTRDRWEKIVNDLQRTALPAYKKQMSILAYLEPDIYGETRMPISKSLAQIAVYYMGHYYFYPTINSKTGQLVDVDLIREMVRAMIGKPRTDAPSELAPLLRVRRAALKDLRPNLDSTLGLQINKMHLAPIVLNFDTKIGNADLPLAEMRKAERGTGDQPLTVFDAGQTFIFDQSHIFFDGAWGAAVAEIMTNEAIKWGLYLGKKSKPRKKTTANLPHSPDLHLSGADMAIIANAPRIVDEVSVENDKVNLKSLLALRKLFKQRSDLLALTVNDILLLYRAIHAVTYTPEAGLVAAMEFMRSKNPRLEAVIDDTFLTFQRPTYPPAILIPVDSSQRNPRDRVYPMSFEVPLDELNLLKKHQDTLNALDSYQSRQRATTYQQFNARQKEYLATLAGFGQVMDRAKEIALTGETTSVATIKMLANMPRGLQRLLDKIPGRFDVLNDIIKGREVFSNVGQVAPGSSLTRFITAKDDNDKKTLAWGVLTDDTGKMRITLRDFRPHVGKLIAMDQQKLAEQVAGHYLASYVQGLNDYVDELRRITQASKEKKS